MGVRSVYHLWLNFETEEGRRSGPRTEILSLFQMECLVPSKEAREDDMVTCGSSLSAVPPRPVHLTSNWAFQLVTDPLAFSRAESFCRSQFSSLVRLDQLEDQEELFSVLQQAGLHPPLWVRSPSKAASTPVGPQRQCE